MNPKDLNELLTAEPFKPLRLTLTTGEVVHIDNPEPAYIHGLTLILCMVERRGSHIADKFRMISLRHIVHVDILETAPQQ